MKKILITRHLPSIAKEMLAQKFKVTVGENRPLSKNEMVLAVQTYEGILSCIEDRWTEEILSQKKALQAISNYAVGLDNIAVEFAQKNGIGIYHLPDIVTNSTAELTFALLLSLIRKICPAQEYVRKDRWKYWEPSLFVGEELYGKTFGILGYGRIGQAVGKIALGFGMKVIFSSRSKMKHSLEVSQVDLPTLFASADVLSLHTPLTSETKGMIHLAAFRQMKKRPILINMARGSVVNSQDLYLALKEGMIRAAALDVTDPEPLSGKDLLCSLENCLIVPHIGTATAECRFAMAKAAAENLLTHFSL